ncbi:MAG: integration host factor subunit beta [Gammaproteobacteria bacterium]|nr:integration host factor subunit beta [Gammaproteobacteria bacterium]
MIKSELIEGISPKTRLHQKDVDAAVKMILKQMSEALAAGSRIEIRGFGSFSVHHHHPRTGRNPKTGREIFLPARNIPHFKPGKALRERVNSASR